MQCSLCKSDMIGGMLGINGMTWVPRLSKFMMKLVGIGSKEVVIAWKCPTCKKVELEIE